MPTLEDVRHERFCQLIATSTKTKMSQGRCYEQAGFRTDARSADACAARLLTRANVKARIAELIEPTVKKTRTTVDTLTEQFDRVFDGALAAEQFGAAGNAAGLKAKLLGFMKEQITVTHRDGEASEGEMLSVIAAELGPMFSLMVGWGLDHDGVMPPVDEIARETLLHIPLPAALEHLDQLRSAMLRAGNDGATVIEGTLNPG